MSSGVVLCYGCRMMLGRPFLLFCGFVGADASSLCLSSMMGLSNSTTAGILKLTYTSRDQNFPVRSPSFYPSIQPSQSHPQWDFRDQQAFYFTRTNESCSSCFSLRDKVRARYLHWVSVPHAPYVVAINVRSLAAHPHTAMYLTPLAMGEG